MTVQSSSFSPRILGVQVNEPPPTRAPLRVQLCAPYTTTLTAALFRTAMPQTCVCENGWLLVQLSREGIGLLGLPLDGNHPAGTWRAAWEDDRVSFFKLTGSTWSPLEDWEDISPSVGAN